MSFNSTPLRPIDDDDRQAWLAIGNVLAARRTAGFAEHLLAKAEMRRLLRVHEPGVVVDWAIEEEEDVVGDPEAAVPAGVAGEVGGLPAFRRGLEGDV